jgi:voltage-gated potassium channel
MGANESRARRRARPNLIEHSMKGFMREPPTVRAAAKVIVTATAVVVVVGGVLMRVLDHSEYPNIWVGMWWALQTVTTVGYGDVTPRHTSGRIIAAFVMLEGVAFVTIVVASITSTFVARAAKDRRIRDAADAESAEVRVEARLTAIEQRLEGIERLLRKS